MVKLEYYFIWKSPFRLVRQNAELSREIWPQGFSSSHAWILIYRTRPIDPQVLLVSKPLISSIAVVTLSEDVCALCGNNGFRWLQLSSESTKLVMLWYYTRVVCRFGQTQKGRDQSIFKDIFESIRGVSLVHAQVLFYWTTILLLSLVTILEIETEFFSSDLVLLTTSLTLREIRYLLAREQSLSLDTSGSFSLWWLSWYTSLYRLST